MATSFPTSKNAGTTVRHCKQDALSEREFEHLLAATYALDGYWALESRFIVLVAGRLGLRSGEIVHMDESWINWTDKRIEIPPRDPCEKGRDGGPCAICRRLAKQKADIATANLIDETYERLTRDDVLEPGGGRVHRLDTPTQEDYLATMWSPKTEKAIRAVPFDFSTRTELVIEEFFDTYDEFPVTYQSLKRRVTRAAEAAPAVDDGLYPHALRATAATFHADRGLGTLALMGLMGWSKLSTAEAYLSGSSQNVQRSLRAVHSR